MANPVDVSGLVVPQQNFSGAQAILNKLWMHNMQTQRFQSLEQQRELQRQAAAAKLIGTDFKDQNFATGTAADPLLHDQTSSARKALAQYISANPNAGEGDLQAKAEDLLNPINKLATTVKAGKAQIDDELKRYQNLPGIDTDTLRVAAMKNMLYDDKGKLKNPDDIDLNQSYVQKTLLGPQGSLFVQGDTPFLHTLDQYKGLGQDRGDIQKGSVPGARTVDKWSGTLFPWNSLQKDDNGKVTGITTNYEPAMIGGQPLIDPQTHQPMKIADEQTTQAFMNPAMEAQLKRDTDQFIRQNGMKPQDFTPGSEAYNIIGRHVLYNKLEQATPNKFKVDQEVNPTVRVLNVQAGVQPASAASQKVNFAQAIGHIFNNDPDYQQGAVVPVNGKNMIDITQSLPAGDLKAGKGENFDYKSIYYDPQKRSLLINKEVETEDRNGAKSKKMEQQEIPEDKVGQFVTRISLANGVPPTKAKQLLNEMGYKDGKFQNAGAALPMKQPDEGVKPPAPDKIGEYLKTGTLTKLKGVETPDGKIQEAGKRSGFNPRSWAGDDYYIEFANGNKKTFNGKAAMDSYIKKSQQQPANQQQSSGKHPLPSGQPQTVKQGNYTYTWNEDSGQYE